MTGSDVLISADELLSPRLRTAPAPRLLDVRWTLPKPDGRDDFAAGHIPARSTSTSTPSSPTTTTTDPLPVGTRCPRPRRSRQRSGHGASMPTPRLVVYDDNSSLGAARAWWLLRWAGVRARVLDGGLTAYRKAGGELAAGDSAEVEPSSIVLRPGSLPVIDADAAAAWDGVLLDARAGERFRGETEPLDPRAGHIPGAKNAPAAENVPAGTFLPETDLRQRFSALGALDQPVGVYSGSGVTGLPQCSGAGHSRYRGQPLPRELVRLVIRSRPTGRNRRLKLSHQRTRGHAPFTLSWVDPR